MATQSTGSGSFTAIEWSSHADALEPGEFIIGRSRTCSIQIEDPSVSREHLMLRVADKVTVEDIGSTNGSLVNGEPLRGVREVADRDEIQIGRRSFRVRIEGPMDTIPYQAEAPTPVFALSRGTQQGLGAVGVSIERQCPECGPLPAGAEACPSCGRTWQKGRVGSATIPDGLPALRAAPRFRVSLAAGYRSERLSLDCAVTDLSAQGCFLKTQTPDHVGTLCDLELRDGEDMCLVRAYVKHAIHRGHRGKQGMGVEFIDLDTRASRWLARRIEHARAQLDEE